MLVRRKLHGMSSTLVRLTCAVVSLHVVEPPVLRDGPSKRAAYDAKDSPALVRVRLRQRVDRKMVVRASVTHVDTSVVPHGPASPKYAKFSGGVLNRAARILGYVEEGQIRAIQGATGWLLHGS